MEPGRAKGLPMSKKRTLSSRRTLPALAHFFFQSKTGMQMLGSTLVFLGLSAFFVYQAFAEQYQQIISIFQVVDVNLQHELVMNDVFIRNLTFLGLTALSYAVSLGFLFFRAQQHFEGPLSAIEAFAADMSRGEYRHRIVTRQGDHLQELVHNLNQMAEALEQKQRQGQNAQASTPEYDKTAGS